MAWTKLFHKILASSVWMEDHPTVRVWITFLALKDQNHIVYGAIPGIANIARVTVQECEVAIKKFESPDPYDSSGVREGQRIERLANGGWLVVNGASYRDAKDDDERRAYHAAYMVKWRARQKDHQRDVHVKVGEGQLSSVNTEQIRTDQIRLDLSPNGDSPDGEKKTKLASPDFWESLKKDPLFSGIDFDSERRKMAIWKKIPANSKRQITERFVLNWLSKAERNVEKSTLPKSCL